MAKFNFMCDHCGRSFSSDARCRNGNFTGLQFVSTDNKAKTLCATCFYIIMSFKGFSVKNLDTIVVRREKDNENNM